MKGGNSKVQQQKTKECSLYGFLIQQRNDRDQTVAGKPNGKPYSKLLQFCQFLVNNGHPKGHQVKFRDTMTMYEPKQRENYWKVAQLITHQKVAPPVYDSSYPDEQRFENAMTAITDFERVSADLTGSSGVYSQSQKLKLFSDQLQKQSNVTIKKCHMVRAAKNRTEGQNLSDLGMQFKDHTDMTLPRADPGLRFFVEGSGFKSKAVKQLIGDEFKFILNDYPNICRFAVSSDDVRTVKLRIYKVFQEKVNKVQNYPYNNNWGNRNAAIEDMAPHKQWKESNILEDLFEEDESQDEAVAKQNPDTIMHDDNQMHMQPHREDMGMYQGQNQGMGYPPYPIRDFSQAYPSEPSIFEMENSKMTALQQQQMGLPPIRVHEEVKVEPESAVSNLELYHVELTGMCTDTDQQAYTKMLADFAQKFSSFVELAPITLNSLSEINQQ